VSTLIFYRRRAERLAQLLDEADGGRRHHVRDRVDEDLAELVAVGHRIAAIRPSVDVEAEPDFRAGLRAMLIATAERDGIGLTAEPDAESDAAVRRTGRRRSSAGLTAQRARARGAIVVGVVAGAIAVSGMSAASENAVPGDALYGVKRSTERAQLALASSDLSRGQLSLDFARTRLAEAQTVRRDSVGFAAVLDDMDADTRQGVKLMSTSAMQRRDKAALDAIGTFLTGQRPAVAGLVDGATAANRKRALTSLALLDSIEERADLLRRTLSCGPQASAGTDTLGPLPRSCAMAAAPSRAQRQQQSTPSPQPAEEAGSESATGSAAPDSAETTPSDAPSPADQPGDKADDGLLDGIGRLLNGIVD
jgi:hypothetical protein